MGWQTIGLGMVAILVIFGFLGGLGSASEHREELTANHSVSPGEEVQAGETFTITYAVTNHGPGPFADDDDERISISLNEELPDGWAIVDTYGASGDWRPHGEPTWVFPETYYSNEKFPEGTRRPTLTIRVPNTTTSGDYRLHGTFAYRYTYHDGYDGFQELPLTITVEQRPTPTPNQTTVASSNATPTETRTPWTTPDSTPTETRTPWPTPDSTSEWTPEWTPPEETDSPTPTVPSTSMPSNLWTALIGWTFIGVALLSALIVLRGES